MLVVDYHRVAARRVLRDVAACAVHVDAPSGHVHGAAVAEAELARRHELDEGEAVVDLCGACQAERARRHGDGRDQCGGAADRDVGGGALMHTAMVGGGVQVLGTRTLFKNDELGATIRRSSTERENGKRRQL